jgi:hypothetical protein
MTYTHIIFIFKYHVSNVWILSVLPKHVSAVNGTNSLLRFTAGSISNLKTVTQFDKRSNLPVT